MRNNKLIPPTCDPKILRKIFVDWSETLSKPRLVKENLPFTIVDEDNDSEETYSINSNHPQFILADCCEKFIGTDDWEKTWSYSSRISSALSFVRSNEEYLVREGLIENTETHQLVALIIYEAAATCKIGKNGFKFMDMVKEIKKIRPTQSS